jgi:hypothetical protein
MGGISLASDFCSVKEQLPAPLPILFNGQLSYWYHNLSEMQELPSSWAQG